MIYAGIDGGGTKTVLVFSDQRGHEVARNYFGAFNINSIGREQFGSLIEEIFTVITDRGACGGVCIGAAGVTNPAVAGMIRAAAARFGLSGGLRLVGDHEIALYGATGGEPGSILIAGTGSICTGLNQQGLSVRAGGFGHLIDDAGSGYALGRDALAALVQAWDGRGDETVLSGLIPAALGVADPGGLIAAVYGGADKSLIASLAVVVEEAGRMGDAIALEIIRRNARALTGLVDAVYRRLEMEGMNLTLLGGLLIHETLLRAAVTEELRSSCPQVRIREARLDAAGGAALLARQSLDSGDGSS